MSITSCKCCGGDYYWLWEEAFLKFGYDDGDAIVMTPTVAKALTKAGYVVERRVWGLHNKVIVSILMDGVEQIPLDRIKLGYDDPRDYLPEAIIAVLDDTFAQMARIEP